MPLSRYGVLVARAVDRRREGAEDDTPHYQIRLQDAAGTSYRAAVNVRSRQAPPDLLYVADTDFRHPVTARLLELEAGWHGLPSRADGAALDFVRGNLFDPAELRSLPPDLPGVDNDLADLLDHHVLRAIADPSARLYVYGARWPTEPAPDKVFGFRPGNGVHDVHMNQGSSGTFRRDNGVWQDGALLLHLTGEDRWVAVFLAFQSQAWHTDDDTEHPLETAPPRPEEPGREPVRIIAALANPRGPAPEAETVTLLNASPAAVDLTGWRLADQAAHTCAIPGIEVAAGDTLVVRLHDGVQLSNRGGGLSLLDPQGLKVDGVSYTRQMAQREGWTLVF
jgi:uncharacterized protein YukJ